MEMRRRVTLESPGAHGVTRMQPMLTPTQSSVTAMSVMSSTTSGKTPTTSRTKSFSGNLIGHGRDRSKVGEAVGGTAAVVCFGPFAVINLAILAVYRVPSGLCKRALKKKKSLKRRRLLKKRNGNSSESDGPWPVGLGFFSSSDDDDDDDEDDEDESDSMELENEKMEEEMWGQFYRGFWRSPSQKGEFD